MRVKVWRHREFFLPTKCQPTVLYFLKKKKKKRYPYVQTRVSGQDRGRYNCWGTKVNRIEYNPEEKKTKKKQSEQMLKRKIQIESRTVSSEAMSIMKLFVDNNSGNDTSAVCPETMDTAANTACHHLP